MCLNNRAEPSGKWTSILEKPTPPSAVLRPTVRHEVGEVQYKQLRAWARTLLPSAPGRQGPPGKRRSSRRAGLVSPHFLPILWTSLSPALLRKWSDTARKASPGIRQGKQSFSGKTQVLSNTSLSNANISLTMTLKHLLPRYLDFIPKFKDNTINHM